VSGARPEADNAATEELHVTAPADQLALEAKCSRCGRALMDDGAIADDLGRVLVDIDKAKLRWPVGVAGDLRVIATALRCRLGTCGGRGG
jgi:hypothetical protein